MNKIEKCIYSFGTKIAAKQVALYRRSKCNYKNFLWFILIHFDHFNFTLLSFNI